MRFDKVVIQMYTLQPLIQTFQIQLVDESLFWCYNIYKDVIV